VRGHGRAVRACGPLNDTMAVTIQRGERQIIPRGDTVFLIGDRVTLLARAASIAELQE